MCIRDRYQLIEFHTSGANSAGILFTTVFTADVTGISYCPVSYTHLDVYKRQPLLNRSIMGQFPPGSTFKTTQATNFPRSQAATQLPGSNQFDRKKSTASGVSSKLSSHRYLSASRSFWPAKPICSTAIPPNGR